MNPTSANILGPFYRGPTTGYEYAPNRLILSPPGAAGQELEFNFQVRTTANSPVGGYWVEIWQADTNGIYDLSNPRPPDTPQEFWANTGFYRTTRFIYNARARAVWTVVPGAYHDPSLGLAREPHLHVIIRAPGHAPLVTQVFPPRDPGLPPSPDPYYQPQNSFAYFTRVGNLIVAGFVFYLP
jgi:protocatechuate 3,4-dioxygenase beta subunit